MQLLVLNGIDTGVAQPHMEQDPNTTIPWVTAVDITFMLKPLIQHKQMTLHGSQVVALLHLDLEENA